MVETNEFERFRYNLEHDMIPKSYYNAKINLLNSTLDKGGKFFSDIYLIYSPISEIVYTEEDFKISQKRVMNDDKMLYFVIVDMPEPKIPTFCRRVYFCCEVETGLVRYYTSELTIDGSFFICSWNKHMNHSNYGLAPVDKEQEFRKVGNMFLKYVNENK